MDLEKIGKGGGMLPEFVEFYNPTKVIYGPGIISDFKTELDALGVKKYFIISDRVISELGLIEKLKKGLDYADIQVTGSFFEVPQDADLEAIKAGAEQAGTSGTEGLIALGGGSVIDTAKAANILISEGGDLIADYAGTQTLTRPLKPLIVLPTTAGTGSEVTIAALVYDKKNKAKLSFSDKFLLPNLAVLDPELTLSLPPRLTASTAMDALSHAVEAYVGLQWSPFSDALAAGTVNLIFKNVIRAVENGQDLEARGSLQIAANMAGIAFSHSMVGCVHSMAHAVGEICRVPHSLANAILLPHGMEYNFEQVKEKFAELAPIMGEEITGLPDERSAAKAIEAVKKLRRKLNELSGIPLRLRDAGVAEEKLPEIADLAAADGTIFYNPREVTAEEIMAPLKKAY